MENASTLRDLQIAARPLLSSLTEHLAVLNADGRDRAVVDELRQAVNEIHASLGLDVNSG